VARGTECLAHKHRTLVPLERHHIRPQSRDGKTVATNLATVCGNTHGNVHYLLDRIEDATMTLRKKGQTYDGKPETAYLAVSAEERRTYSSAEQRLAKEGWAGYAEAFWAGAFDRHYLLLSTSGHPKVESIRATELLNTMRSTN
jgi:hypothetical protein